MKLEEIYAVLEAALADYKNIKECVFIDTPQYHLNVGDHMIYLGEKKFFSENNVKIRYESSYDKFDVTRFEKNLGDTTIFIHGGGNLGDLWRHEQDFKEFIISKYTENRIVILPQTLYFKNEGNLERTKKIFNNHPDLTIILREKRSFEFARDHFKKCSLKLAPDAAFFLCSDMEKIYKRAPGSGALFLCRNDRELKNGSGLNIPGITRMDWIDEIIKRNSGLKILSALLALLKPFLRRRFYLEKRDGFFSRFPISSEKLLDITTGLFSGYRLIITNRLHAHILALCMGMPCILLPNIYYKNRSFFETWTRDIPGAYWAESKEEISKIIKNIDIRE